MNTKAALGYCNMHAGDAPAQDIHAMGCNNVPLTPIDTHTAVHTYDVVWQPGSIDWYIDGT